MQSLMLLSLRSASSSVCLCLYTRVDCRLVLAASQAGLSVLLYWCVELSTFVHTDDISCQQHQALVRLTTLHSSSSSSSARFLSFFLFHYMPTSFLSALSCVVLQTMVVLAVCFAVNNCAIIPYLSTSDASSR